MLGIPDKYAMERGSWSSSGVLKSVYQHMFSEERKQADERTDGYFNNLLRKHRHPRRGNDSPVPSE